MRSHQAGDRIGHGQAVRADHELSGIGAIAGWRPGASASLHGPVTAERIGPAFLGGGAGHAEGGEPSRRATAPDDAAGTRGSARPAPAGPRPAARGVSSASAGDPARSCATASRTRPATRASHPAGIRASAPAQGSASATGANDPTGRATTCATPGAHSTALASRPAPPRPTGPEGAAASHSATGPRSGGCVGCVGPAALPGWRDENRIASTSRRYAKVRRLIHGGLSEPTGQGQAAEGGWSAWGHHGHQVQVDAMPGIGTPGSIGRIDDVVDGGKQRSED